MHFKLAKTMFNALVQFIHFQNEFIPPKRLNCKFFLSKILERLFKTSKKTISQKDQMIWDSFLKYHEVHASLPPML